MEEPTIKRNPKGKDLTPEALANLKRHAIKPGEVRNPYGSKGNPNKPKPNPEDGVDPRTIRKRLQSVVDFNMEKIQQDLDKLSPRDRVAFIMSAMQYCTPKLIAAQVKSDIDRAIIFPQVNIGNPRNLEGFITVQPADDGSDTD